MKKKLAFFLALIMALSMSTVSVSATAQTLTGTAEVLVATSPATHVVVTLPTTATFDFYLDPDNMLDIGLDEARPVISRGSGTIVFPHEVNFPSPSSLGASPGAIQPIVLNWSAVPVRVGIEFDVTTSTSPAVNLVTEYSALRGNDERNVFFEVSSTTGNIRTASPAAALVDLTRDKATLAALRPLMHLNYVLAESEWEDFRESNDPAEWITRMSDDAQSNGFALQINGELNYNAEGTPVADRHVEWTDDAEVAIEVKFDFSVDIPPALLAASDQRGAHGFRGWVEGAMDLDAPAAGFVVNENVVSRVNVSGPNPRLYIPVYPPGLGGGHIQIRLNEGAWQDSFPWFQWGPGNGSFVFIGVTAATDVIDIRLADGTILTININ